MLYTSEPRHIEEPKGRYEEKTRQDQAEWNKHGNSHADVGDVDCVSHTSAIYRKKRF